MTKILPISSDDRNGFKLDDTPPHPPIVPGGSMLFDCRLQHGPVLFGRLIVSPQVDVSIAGEAIMWSTDSWRVDDVTLDGSPVVLTDGRVDPPRLAGRVAMRVTNVGQTPAYFYGCWKFDGGR